MSSTGIEESSSAATDWRDRCGKKLTDPAKALAQIKPGQNIYLSAGSAVPLGIMPYLCDPAAPLADHTIYHLMTLGDAPYAAPQMAGRFRHNALFIGPNVRSAVADGRADYTPVFLSEIPKLIRADRIPIDVAIVAVSPPDAYGEMTFGTHVDLAPAACDAAQLVIAVVNPKMPRTYGPCRLHVSQADVVCEIEHDLPELKSSPKPEAEAIAANIAELIPDGATLQLGIGGIPDSVLTFLRDRNDLGIHTEMFSDGVVDLVKRGVINGARKNLHTRKLITSFMMGTKAAYDFVHENPMVEFHPVDYTNDPYVIGQNDCMCAINTCIQIDLTGQVVSDSIGERFYSGIGGQVDFIRGAARSKGGRPIIALPSTAAGGIVSRIVPRLGDGAGVVTTRGDVHWVVSEFGAVNLHGLNVRERAMALISISHPKFRSWLLAEAKRRKVVYLDQKEPALQTPLYPRKLETRIKSRDGRSLLLRPVKPTDEWLLREMFYRLSKQSVYQRFFSTRKTMPHENLQEFCTIDYEKDLTLVATVIDGEVERIVGWALYSIDREDGFAEAAFLVVDDWQGKGLGTRMMRRLTEIAEVRGINGFTAVVLASNVPMLHVFEKCGYPIETQNEGEMILLRIPFHDTTRESWAAQDAAAAAATPETSAVKA